jgi:hypothetical protein
MMVTETLAAAVGADFRKDGFVCITNYLDPDLCAEIVSRVGECEKQRQLIDVDSASLIAVRQFKTLNGEALERAVPCVVEIGSAVNALVSRFVGQELALLKNRAIAMSVNLTQPGGQVHMALRPEPDLCRHLPERSGRRRLSMLSQLPNPAVKQPFGSTQITSVRLRCRATARAGSKRPRNQAHGEASNGHVGDYGFEVPASSVAGARHEQTSLLDLCVRLSKQGFQPRSDERLLRLRRPQLAWISSAC